MFASTLACAGRGTYSSTLKHPIAPQWEHAHAETLILTLQGAGVRVDGGIVTFQGCQIYQNTVTGLVRTCVERVKHPIALDVMLR